MIEDLEGGERKDGLLLRRSESGDLLLIQSRRLIGVEDELLADDVRDRVPRGDACVFGLPEGNRPGRGGDGGACRVGGAVSEELGTEVDGGGCGRRNDLGWLAGNDACESFEVAVPLRVYGAVSSGLERLERDTAFEEGLAV